MIPLKTADDILFISQDAIKSSITLANLITDCDVLNQVNKRSEAIVKLETAKLNKASDVELQRLEAEIPKLDDIAIPIPNIDTETLKLVIAFMEQPMQESTSTGVKTPPILSDFEKTFVEMNHIVNADVKIRNRLVATQRLNLISAAIYLDIPRLQNVCAYTVAMNLRNKTVEEIRDEYSIVNDYTEAELKELELENEWLNE